MKKQFVDTIKAGDSVEDVFVLYECSIATKKDGNPFLNITLSDRTGRIKGVIWENADQLSSALAAADFVRVNGSASQYMGKLQLTIRQVEITTPEGIDAADFIPATTRSIDGMFEKLVELVRNKMKNPHLLGLMEAFFADEKFVRGFKTAPAAKKMHHAYLGGLLEHTLSMAILVERLGGHYSGIDMDLLLAGAVLHDIGKIREFDYSCRIDYSDEGRFLSHILIGCEMIAEKIGKLPDFPGELALLVKHMVVSHHGTREFGSPELPKTIEAVLLNHIDDIDAKMNGIRDFIAKKGLHRSWTSYHNLYGRHFYRGRDGEVPEPMPQNGEEPTEAGWPDGEDHQEKSGS